MDVNLNNFLTDSDGTVIDTPKYLKKSEKKLKKDKGSYPECKNVQRKITEN